METHQNIIGERDTMIEKKHKTHIHDSTSNVIKISCNETAPLSSGSVVACGKAGRAIKKQIYQRNTGVEKKREKITYNSRKIHGNKRNYKLAI